MNEPGQRQQEDSLGTMRYELTGDPVIGGAMQTLPVGLRLCRDRRCGNSSRLPLVALLLVVLVCGPMQHLKADEAAVSVARVTIGLVRQAKVSTRDAGTLAELLVREGQPVREGEIIAVLENEQQTLNVKAAQLNQQVASIRAEDRTAIQTAEAQLQEAKSGLRVRETTLRIALAEADSDVSIQIAAAETKLRQLELDRAERSRSSFKGSISESQIDRLRTSVEKGNLEVQHATRENEIANMKPDAERAAIEQKNDEIRRFEALVRQQETDLLVAKVNQELQSNEIAVAELRLEHRNVRAPFDGIVVAVDGRVGEWVEPGVTVVRVIDLSTLQAEGFLPVHEASLNLVGRPVSLEISSISLSQPLSGEVVFVSPEVDPVNQQVRFKVEFANPGLRVLPGMSGTLTIQKPKTSTGDAQARP